MSTYDAYLIARGMGEDLITMDTIERFADRPGCTDHYRQAVEKKLERLSSALGFRLVPLSTEQKEAA